MSTLFLNADFTPFEMSPLSTIGWEESMKAYFSDKFQIVKTYDDWKVHSAYEEFDVPSIIVATRYQRMPEHAKLTRKNLFIRDNYRCQYCGVSFLYHELTFDHVVPRKDGGGTSWNNIVAACNHCNVKKGHKRDIRPIRLPHEPSYREIYNQSKCYRLTIPDPAWQDFIQWPQELLTIKPQ